jgi:hypothetical protein
MVVYRFYDSEMESMTADQTREWLEQDTSHGDGLEAWLFLPTDNAVIRGAVSDAVYHYLRHHRKRSIWQRSGNRSYWYAITSDSIIRYQSKRRDALARLGMVAPVILAPGRLIPEVAAYLREALRECEQEGYQATLDRLLPKVAAYLRETLRDGVQITLDQLLSDVTVYLREVLRECEQSGYLITLEQLLPEVAAYLQERIGFSDQVISAQ